MLAEGGSAINVGFPRFPRTLLIPTHKSTPKQRGLHPPLRGPFPTNLNEVSKPTRSGPPKSAPIALSRGWKARSRAYNAGSSAIRATHHGSGARAAVSVANCGSTGAVVCDYLRRFLRPGLGRVLHPVMIFDTRTDTCPETYRDYQAQNHAIGRERLAHWCSGEIPWIASALFGPVFRIPETLSSGPLGPHLFGAT